MNRMRSCLLLFLLLTLYLPALVLVNGKVTVGHIAAGYLGMAMLGAATIAIGAFWSSTAPNQIVAVMLTTGTLIAFSICWLLAKKVSGAPADVLTYLDFFNNHFRSFSRGTVRLGSVAYFVAITYGALMLTTAQLSSRRWRA